VTKRAAFEKVKGRIGGGYVIVKEKNDTRLSSAKVTGRTTLC
jgi:hypothetical protein